jgi:uncharacterized protein YutE (UPF0331/DUF86 family)
VTDHDLVEKKLAFVDTCVGELGRLASPDDLERDVKERRFVEHTLQIAIQAALDIAAHIVSDDRLGEPRTNQELFTLLGNAGWIDPALGEALRAAVGFRNVLVHGYTAVDPRIVRDVLVNHLGDLTAFTAAIRARIGAGSSTAG